MPAPAERGAYLCLNQVYSPLHSIKQLLMGMDEASEFLRL
jgi:hypothetical protein